MPAVIDQAPAGFVSVRRAAEWAGVSTRTVWRLVAASVLTRHRVGRRTVVELAELDRAVRAGAETRKASDP